MGQLPKSRLLTIDPAQHRGTGHDMTNVYCRHLLESVQQLQQAVANDGSGDHSQKLLCLCNVIVYRLTTILRLHGSTSSGMLSIATSSLVQIRYMHPRASVKSFVGLSLTVTQCVSCEMHFCIIHVFNVLRGVLFLCFYYFSQNIDKINSLQEKHSLRKSPCAFGSHLAQCLMRNAKICGMGENSWHAEVFAAVWAKALVGSSPATAIVAAKQSDQPSCASHHARISINIKLILMWEKDAL